MIRTSGGGTVDVGRDPSTPAGEPACWWECTCGVGGTGVFERVRATAQAHARTCTVSPR